jgi:hypothetical protein
MKQEEEKINIPNASVSENTSSEIASSSKKPRKPYEWTEKRKEAFDKMRKGLEEKVTLTKRIKDEKKRSEKEAIKAKVKEIMNSKKGAIVTQESDSASGDSSSEEEAPVRRKKTKEEKRVVLAKEEKKSSKRKKAREVSSEEEQEASADSSSEEEAAAHHQNHLSTKQHQHFMKSKVDRGKAVRSTPFVNPLDQFILL